MQTIALLFCQKLAFFIAEFFGQKLSDFCTAKFWSKIQGYSLTFLEKFTIGSIMTLQVNLYQAPGWKICLFLPT